MQAVDNITNTDLIDSNATGSNENELFNADQNTSEENVISDQGKFEVSLEHNNVNSATTSNIQNDNSLTISKQEPGHKQFICKLCGKAFPRKSALNKHKGTHKLRKSYQCQECKKRFRTQKHLIVHEQIHLNIKPFKCQYCRKLFKRKDHLAVHETKHDKGFTADHQEMDLHYNQGRGRNKPNLRRKSLNSHGMKVGDKKTANSDLENNICHRSLRVKQQNYKPYGINGGIGNKESEIMTSDFASNTDDISIQVYHTIFGYSADEDLPVSKSNEDNTSINEEEVEQTIYDVTPDISEGNEDLTPGLMCQFCGKCFRIQSTFTRHKNKHACGKCFECQFCGKTFNQRFHLSTHEKTHNVEKPFCCTICNKSFSQKIHLTTHEKRHSGAKPYPCKLCGKSFTQKGHLAIHERRHAGIRPYYCLECGRSFTVRGALDRHMKVHMKEHLFKCEECGEQFKTSNQLITHQKIHNLQNFQCHQCFVSFLNQESLNLHAQMHTQNSIDLFENKSQNNEIFENKFFVDEVESDMNSAKSKSATATSNSTQEECSVTDDSIMPGQNQGDNTWVADIQDMLQVELITGNEQANADEHINSPRNNSNLELNLTHPSNSTVIVDNTTVSPYFESAVTCVGNKNDKASEMENYKHLSESESIICSQDDPSHLSVNGIINEINEHLTAEHTCLYCGKNFSVRSRLMKHLQIHSDPKPHQCSMCWKSFTESRHLAVHERRHSGLKPFECLQCGKFFSQKAHLVIHQKRHAGERPFPCSQCSRSFTVKGALERHMYIHSRLEEKLNGSVNCHQCKTCLKSFTKKRNLNLHAKTHKAKCSNSKTLRSIRSKVISGSTSSTISPELIKNKHNIHSQEVVDSIKYQPSSSTSTQNDQLNVKTNSNKKFRNKKSKSTKNTSNVKNGQNEEAQFECRYCGKYFPVKYRLIRHELIHTGIRPFLCQICDKSFTQRGHLDIHYRRHNGVKPYDCSECGLAFTVTGALQRHMRTHIATHDKL